MNCGASSNAKIRLSGQEAEALKPSGSIVVVEKDGFFYMLHGDVAYTDAALKANKLSIVFEDCRHGKADFGESSRIYHAESDRLSFCARTGSNRKSEETENHETVSGIPKTIAFSTNANHAFGIIDPSIDCILNRIHYHVSHKLFA